MKYTKIIEFSDIKVSLFEVWKNIGKCLITALLFLAFGIIVTLGNNVDNTYFASTNLYCPVTGNYAETSNAVEIISSYSSLIESQKVAERAVSLLGNTNLTYRNILDMITYSKSENGINLTITAYSDNSEMAIHVSNAVANAFVEEMRNMMGMDVVQILSAADKASLSNNGIREVWTSRIEFFIAGFALSAIFVFLKELFSDKLRSVDQCMITDKDTIIGVIPEIDEINDK